MEKASEKHFQKLIKPKHFCSLLKNDRPCVLIVLTQQSKHILIKSDDFIKLLLLLMLLQFVVAPKRKLKCPNMGSLLKKERQ